MPPLDLEWTDEERELLRSAELDAPPHQGPKKTLAALGIGGAVMTGAVLSGSAQAAQVAAQGSSASTAATVAAGGGKALVIGKWLLLVAAGGSAGGAALYYQAHAAAPVAAPLATTPKAPAPVTPAPVTPAPVTPAPVTPAPVEAAQAAPASDSVAPAKAPLAPPSAHSEPDITLEIAALDRARSASQSGNFAVALSELDQYDREFKQGRLRQEALLLRVQTLMGKGDKAAARALGERFLARYPKSPLSPRIQKLMGVSP